MGLCSVAAIVTPFLSPLTPAVTAASAVPAAPGHDGVISLALPLEEVAIDGDLSEWPEEYPSYGAGNFLVALPNDDADLSVSFQVAFDEWEKRLLVAVKVADDVHAFDATRVNQDDAHDSCMLYLDREHAVDATLPEWHAVRLDEGEIQWLGSSPGASREGIQVAARREGTTTTYEWSFAIEGLAPNRVLGLDVQVSDFDGAGVPMSHAIWGPRASKARITGRLGDVAILDPMDFPGTLEAQVMWKDGQKETPNKLSVTSVDEPGLRFHAAVSPYGRLRIQLPPGEYELAPAYGLTGALDNSGGANRFAPASVRVTVEPDRTVKADPLVLSIVEPLLPKERAVLHRFDESLVPALDTYIEALMAYYEVPGVSVALVDDGKLVYHRTFGYRDRSQGLPVTKETLFEAASITKPVFAFAVMRLVERGVLDLDRPLHEYLAFPNIAKDERSKKMTARMVLSHCTGLPNWAWGGPGGYRRGEELELAFEPGTEFRYSGEGFNYLGRVVSHLTGKGLEELLQEEVAQVVGMEQVHFSTSERLEAVAAKGHWIRDASYEPPPREVSPASSMHTEARDFARFMIALVEKAGLEAETYEEMLRPTRSVPSDPPLEMWPQNIALGFFRRDTPYGPMIEHGGNNGDFRCKFGVFPEGKKGYAIYTNGNIGFRLAASVEFMLVAGEGDRPPGD